MQVGRRKIKHQIKVGDEVYYTVGVNTYLGVVQATNGKKCVIRSGDVTRTLALRKLMKKGV